MKKSTCIILIFLFLLQVSCKKDDDRGNTGTVGSVFPPSPPPFPVTDTIIGNEYIFTDLQWHMGYSEFMEVDYPLLQTPERPDLFGSFRNMKVWVQKNAGSVWVEVRDYYHYSFPVETFFHFGGYQNRLGVLSNGSSAEVSGMKGAIKVLFL
ncbi:MAG: hypothetical protein ABIT05_00205 [Chitinophagaceae bacterium]